LCVISGDGDTPCGIPLKFLKMNLCKDLRLPMKTKGKGARQTANKFTVPTNIGELVDAGKGTELDLHEWQLVGPSLVETMELLRPKFAPTLTKLNLRGCQLGGAMPEDDVWAAFDKLTTVDVSSTGIGEPGRDACARCLFLGPMCLLFLRVWPLVINPRHSCAQIRSSRRSCLPRCSVSNRTEAL